MLSVPIQFHAHVELYSHWQQISKADHWAIRSSSLGQVPGTLLNLSCTAGLHAKRLKLFDVECDTLGVCAAGQNIQVQLVCNQLDRSQLSCPMATNLHSSWDL